MISVGSDARTAATPGAPSRVRNAIAAVAGRRVAATAPAPAGPGPGGAGRWRPRGRRPADPARPPRTRGRRRRGRRSAGAAGGAGRTGAGRAGSGCREGAWPASGARSTRSTGCWSNTPAPADGWSGSRAATRTCSAGAARRSAACREAGVQVDVVPGVTSAFAVPAAAGIPVTHRGLSRQVTVISGHDAARQCRRTGGLAALAAGGGTSGGADGRRRTAGHHRGVAEAGMDARHPGRDRRGRLVGADNG